MKKLISVLASLAMLVSLVPGGISASAAGLQKGDVDGDNNIDASDASKVLLEYATAVNGDETTFTAEQSAAADVNSDNTVDASDASLILLYYSALVNGDVLPWSDDDPVYEITKSAEAFEAYAHDMNDRILQGSSILLDDCNGNEYWMYGDKEAKVALLLMNADIPFDSGVLSKVFEGYTDDDIKNGVLYLNRLALIEEYINVDIDFNNYAIDKKISNYMNSLRNAAKIARETGNCDELDNVLYVVEDDKYQYLWNNYATLMMIIGYGSRIKGNRYFGALYSVKAYDLNNYVNMATDKVKNLIS